MDQYNSFSNFRESNKKVKQKPFPNFSNLLKLEGFTASQSLDLKGILPYGINPNAKEILCHSFALGQV